MDPLQIVVQGIVGIVGTGLVFGLLTLRQQRRKLGADADVAEATAASTLTGSALQMVERAETQAKNADARATRAEDKAQAAQDELDRLIGWLRQQGIRPPEWVTRRSGT